MAKMPASHSKKHEVAEPKALKSGKLTPAAYVKKEKSEGERGSFSLAKAMKSGKVSPAAYAKREAREKK